MALPNTATAYSSFTGTDPQSQSAPATQDANCMVIGQNGLNVSVRYWGDNYGSLSAFTNKQGNSH